MRKPATTSRRTSTSNGSSSLVLLNSYLLCINWQKEIWMDGYITKATSTLNSIFAVKV